MDNDFIREIPPQVKSVEMPLSSRCRVFIILDGEPTEEDFGRLHKIVDLMVDAYIPKHDVEDPFPHYQNRRKKIVACTEHPDADRNPLTQRCRACEIERGRAMVMARTAKVAARKAAEALLVIPLK